jgi:hypothetical protein
MPPTNIPPAASQRAWTFGRQVNAFGDYHEAMPSSSQPDGVDGEEGLLSGPRRLTNRAFDALDEVGDWVLGRRY